jgi:hypothetical protein
VIDFEKIADPVDDNKCFSKEEKEGDCFFIPLIIQNQKKEGPHQKVKNGKDDTQNRK